MIPRKSTRPVYVGDVKIGGDAPVCVQSMTNTDTRDVSATVKQTLRLQAVGCEVVRAAAPDMEAARALGEIRKRIDIPLIADIHFDHRLALESIKQGVDGLRINPGNIGAAWKVRELVEAAREKNIPIRIGVNSGSLEKDILAEEGGVTPAGMVKSALGHIRLLEDMDYREIKLSLKATNVPLTIGAYRMMSERVDYPLHLGITEAGTPMAGAVKSAVGLGIMLFEGIGDTIRVSLTGDPVEEIPVAFKILGALGIRRRGVEFISCPTCGRTQVKLIETAVEVERRLGHVNFPLKVAVMGCAVNGPGEAKEADIGICGGKEGWILFRKGEVVGRLDPERTVDAFVEEVEKEAEAGGWRRPNANPK